MSHGVILLILILPIVPTFWAIIDVAYREFASIKTKALWGVFVVLVPCIGGIVYLLIGRRQGTKTRK
jgi:hypothetical protein